MTDEERRRLMDKVMGRTGKKQPENQSQTSNANNNNQADEPLNNGILFFMYYTIPDEFEIDKSLIKPDANVFETLQLDDLSLVDLLASIEEFFCIKTSGDEVKCLTDGTFADMYWFIAKKIEQQRRQFPSVAALVAAIAVDKLGVDEAEVTSQADWVNDLGCDSLDTVQLLICFEAMFNIQIPDEVAERLKTVGDVVYYIERNAR